MPADWSNSLKNSHDKVITESEYLIVGQGMAGSCLAYNLLQAGKSIAIVDKGLEDAASWIGAGIMNPLVFRYITQSWKADILLPFARNYYTSLEESFGSRFIYDLPIARILGVNEHEKWMVKSKLPQIGRWTKGQLCFPFDREHINYHHGAMMIQEAARVDMAHLVATLRNYFIRQQIFHQDNFDYNQLHESNNGFAYKHLRASRIIFCEGFHAAVNPLFKHIPFRPVKGELLKLHIPGLDERFIINADIFILPLGNSFFKVGSNYNWDDLTNHPSLEIREMLLSKVKDILRLPFELIDHTAGIRPSIADRRPVVGQHPKHKSVYIMNGLGAKGALLAPFFADQLVKLLLFDQKIDDEAVLSRFV